jgi:hypothetical protein
VVRYWKCDSEALGDLREMFQTEVTPIAESMVSEGLIFGWGALQHAWGDEWNWVDYFVTESLSAFLDVWPELVSRGSEIDPAMWENFQASCHEHKDNIYSIVAQVPSG